MKRLLTCLACVVLALPAVAGEAADTPLFSADGYRLTRYRSPTPAQAEAARTLDTPQLQAQLKAQPDTLLVDVYRRQWLQGQFIEDEPHANLPGSLWLANTGDGELSTQWQDYFSRNLQLASGGRHDRALVFYCRSDCWLSWNAVKRAAALGYTNLYWYRDGIDAWEQAGLPLQPARPVPFP
ncbi:PQQ-dependent catabolism-associated CXXCW motif protein [Pseudomonas sp. BN411]|uniref:PQQ-dependent catabolism-associated CXXCW motif protein n=1 Tax=Pseudomonas sp. BN411 TaxID=2567887 RepID=UPI0024539A0E|nr:PQQ-dependent catabolism-associated CXXCW motif protein [Pseudomonas sp. BN411]MDH4561264.1 PQQ-dependent catabolism-associated CXXCW motif protein [Pseudomonas sp. BN411]